MNNYEQPQSFFFRTGIILFIMLLILTGTHIRVRAEDNAPSMDWLVLLQLAISFLAAATGFILLAKKRKPWGVGTFAVLFFLFVAGFSALWSEFPTAVMGYFIILFGFSVLLIGLIKNCENSAQLFKLENAWLITITLILIKDSITSFYFLKSSFYGDVFRLGSNVTHPVTLSFMAVLAFVLSFRHKQRYPALWWGIRLFYIFIIFFARTRVSIIALFLSCFIGLIFIAGKKAPKGYTLKLLIPAGFASLVLFFLLSLSSGSPLAEQTFQVLNRNQKVSKIKSLSSRTDIWNYTMQKVVDDQANLFFGHGYGVSRLVLNRDRDKPGFLIANTHNTFLEFLLDMGIGGAISFLLLALAGVLWFFKFRFSRLALPGSFPLHAILVVIVFLFSSLTESFFATKVGPSDILYLFYILALDQVKIMSV